MESVKDKKQRIRTDIMKQVFQLSDDEVLEKTKSLENRLFEFANFLEAKIVLMYINSPGEVNTSVILKKCFEFEKIVVLPAFDTEKYEMKLLKVNNLDLDLTAGPRGIKEPDADKCLAVPIEYIDIAIIPGIALDEKGGRIGTGEGYYDRLISKLSNTTRKVALAFEDQIIKQVPMEHHDRYVDIVITDKRIIYKI